MNNNPIIKRILKNKYLGVNIPTEIRIALKELIENLEKKWKIKTNPTEYFSSDQDYSTIKYSSELIDCNLKASDACQFYVLSIDYKNLIDTAELIANLESLFHVYSIDELLAIPEDVLLSSDYKSLTMLMEGSLSGTPDANVINRLEGILLNKEADVRAKENILGTSINTPYAFALRPTVEKMDELGLFSKEENLNSIYEFLQEFNYSEYDKLYPGKYEHSYLFNQFKVKEPDYNVLEICSAFPEEYLNAFAQEQKVPDPYEMSFYTNIPFDSDSTLLPSKPDYVFYFYSIDINETPIEALNRTSEISLFPKEILPIAETHYGQLGMYLSEENYGHIYYAWRHIPSSNYYFERRINEILQEFGNGLSEKANSILRFVYVEDLASDWNEFQNNLITEEEIEIENKDIIYHKIKWEETNEQTKRYAALNNIFLLAGTNPTQEQLLIIEETSSGFISQRTIDKIKKSLENIPQLYRLEVTEDNDFVLDKMLDILMLDSSIQGDKYNLCLLFILWLKYPKWELDRSISDYHSSKARKNNQQSPPLDKLKDIYHTNNLAILQSIYLVCSIDGDLAVEQKVLIDQFIEVNEIRQDEFQYIINHAKDLFFAIPSILNFKNQLKGILPMYINAALKSKFALTYEKGLELWNLLGESEESFKCQTKK